MPRTPSASPNQLYLGAAYDIKSKTLTDQPTYYKSSDLVTHGVCIGMTGSGKTGLCVSLLEECALSGVPVIIIDPKGDLTNLELLFPNLDAASFRPWINEETARRKGITADDLATEQAGMWKNGLADWGIDGTRLRELKEKVDTTIFTPGSTAGTPLDILCSFDPPADAANMDDELMREAISGAVSALLGLLGDSNVTSQDREHILIATILEKRWRAGKNTSLTDLINLIQSPPFDKLGALGLESFFPADDRRKLAFSMNTLVASPSFQSWLEGEPLDIQSMLWTKDGKPRMSICYIAHLSDSERMFFVSLLLNQYLSWMRTQSGTPNLRALLYFDEIFGYLPPHPRNPPSKKLLMTLLKQGRAFGAGTMLVTQNPVDIDYKALSNCGTWLLGKMQTEQDKDRILDGLKGALNEAGANSDTTSLDEILSGLGKRVFLLHNVHADQPVVLHSRWAMSYLAGPLARRQLKKLKKSSPASTKDGASSPSATDSLDDFLGSDSAATDANLATVPAVPPKGLSVRFLGEPATTLAPTLFASASILFRDRSSGNTLTRNILLTLSPEDAQRDLDWQAAESLDEPTNILAKAPANTRFHSLPAFCQNVTALKSLGKAIVPHLVATQGIEGYKNTVLKTKSNLGESLDAFKTRLESIGDASFKKSDGKLRAKAATALKRIEAKVAKEQAELERDQERVASRKSEEKFSLLSGIGGIIASIMSGSKASGIRKVSTVFKGASSKRGIVARAELEVTESEQALAQLAEDADAIRDQLEADSDILEAQIEADKAAIITVTIAPAKTNTRVEAFGILWRE